MTRRWRHRPRRLEDGGDLDGMMAVVVEDLDAVPAAGVGEAALDPAEAGEASGNGALGYAQVMGDCNRRGCVLHVVLARHGDRQVFHHHRRGTVAALNQDRELRAAVDPVEVGIADVGLRARAVGDDAAVLDAADQAPCTSGWSWHITAKP